MRPRPLTADRKRHVARVAGVLRPDCIYTTEGLMRSAGIGREVLMSARASGMVMPIEIGRRVYYCGAELIRWIHSQRRQGAKEVSDDRRDSANRCHGVERHDDGAVE